MFSKCIFLQIFLVQIMVFRTICFFSKFVIFLNCATLQNFFWRSVLKWNKNFFEMWSVLISESCYSGKWNLLLRKCAVLPRRYRYILIYTQENITLWHIEWIQQETLPNLARYFCFSKNFLRRYIQNLLSLLPRKRSKYLEYFTFSMPTFKINFYRSLYMNCYTT